MSLAGYMDQFFAGRMGSRFFHQVFNAGQRLNEFVDVVGCYDHTIQISTLNGTDILRVRASVDGTTFEQITIGLDAMSANGLYLFSGSFRRLQFTKTSGAGTTTNLWYAGRP
jgi:hypothetical protein